MASIAEDYPIKQVAVLFYDDSSTDELDRLSQALEEQAVELQDEDYRSKFTELGPPGFWDWIRGAWDLVGAFSADGLDRDELRAAFGLGLARVARNVVAGNPEGQNRMLENEPAMRRVLQSLSSYEHLASERLLPLIRALTQALSNLLTGSAAISTQLLPSYFVGPFDSNLVCRLLASKDARTLFSVLVLLRNGLDACPSEVDVLCSPAPGSCGVPIMELLLAKMDLWFAAAAEDGEDAAASGAAFDAGYDVVRHVFSQNRTDTLYASLAHPSFEEPLSSAQLTLLKLYDAHLSSPSSSSSPSNSQFLAPVTNTLLCALHTALMGGSGASPAAGGKAGRLMEGAVVSLGAVLGLGLAESERKEIRGREGETDKGDSEASFLDGSIKGFRDEDGSSIVDVAIVLLRQLELVAPRLLRAAPSPPNAPPSAPTPSPFAPIRRDIVRLLGLLAHGDPLTQDALRDKGGLDLVLSLTAMDDTHPYLREHALFALRSMLVGSVANQQAVRELEPVGVVNEDGTLGDLPDRWKGSVEGAGPEAASSSG